MLQLPSMPRRRRPENDSSGEDQFPPRVEFDSVERSVLAVVALVLVLVAEYLFAAVYTAADSSFNWVVFQAMWVEYIHNISNLELQELFLTFAAPIIAAYAAYNA